MEPGKTLRADGRRNREALVTAAAALIARDGAQASLEEIARSAGVGSATLHRHFPTRGALLEAVFRDGVAQLAARGRAHPGDDPGAELAAWLEDLTVYTATHRGLAFALLAAPDGYTAEEICCTDLLREVLDGLVKRALVSKQLRPGATSGDLLALTNAIAVAKENDAKGASRLLRLALDGVRI